MTNPHNFTLDRKTEKIFSEFQDLARKEGKTVSQLIRKFIINYVESRNARVMSPTLVHFSPNNHLTLLLPQKPIDPYPSDKQGQDNWIKKYPKRTTVRYAK